MKRYAKHRWHGIYTRIDMQGNSIGKGLIKGKTVNSDIDENNKFGRKKIQNWCWKKRVDLIFCRWCTGMRILWRVHWWHQSPTSARGLWAMPGLGGYYCLWVISICCSAVFPPDKNDVNKNHSNKRWSSGILCKLLGQVWLNSIAYNAHCHIHNSVPLQDIYVDKYTNV